MKKSRKLVIAWMTLATLAVGAWFALPGQPRPAPDATFRVIDGRMLTLNELRGRPVLVAFWATTCAVCMEEMPEMVALYEDLSPRGFELVGVAMAYDPPNRVVELARRVPIPYPVSLDVDGELAKRFANVTVTPSHFLIDTQGRIVDHGVGRLDTQDIRARVEAML